MEDIPNNITGSHELQKAIKAITVQVSVESRQREDR